MYKESIDYLCSQYPNPSTKRKEAYENKKPHERSQNKKPENQKDLNSLTSNDYFCNDECHRKFIDFINEIKSSNIDKDILSNVLTHYYSWGYQNALEELKKEK